MKDLIVDPYVISARGYTTQDEASIFIEHLIHWLSVQRRTGCRLVLSENCLCALFMEDQYPTWNKLREIHQIARNQIFDTETVCRAFEQIIDMSPRIENIIGITEILIEEDKTNVVPSYIVGRLPPKVADALNDTLAACALYTDIGGMKYPLGFITESPPAGTKHGIECKFLVLDFVGSSQATISLPLEVMLQLPLLTNTEDVLGILDFDSVCYDIECAIQWSWVHAIPLQNRANHSMLEFMIREEFKKRIVSLGLPSSILKQVYRKVTYLLCGLHSAGLQIEPLRIDRGPNSVQKHRPRDRAKAFRMQISQHGAGYHVHYWHCVGDLIEIAWVGPHDDYFIPE